MNRTRQNTTRNTQAHSISALIPTENNPNAKRERFERFLKARGVRITSRPADASPEVRWLG